MILEGLECEDMEPGALCPFCRKGSMVLVDEERDVPGYMCPACGAYHGEFLHTGKVFYYTPLHLSIGRIILAKGIFRESTPISSLSVEISHQISPQQSPEEIMEGILYLSEMGVVTVIDGMVASGGEE